MRDLFLIGSIVGLFALSGCAALPQAFPWGQPMTVATAENPAVELVCLWDPAEGRDPQGLPARGFNGQLLFFTRGSDAPAIVDGTVKIYVFDEYGPPAQWSTPVSEFEFAPEEWSTFLSRGMLGPGYQLFVPYLRKHGDQANCTLRVRFTPADGGPAIYSRVSKITLPGMRPTATTDGSIEDHLARRAQVASAPVVTQLARGDDSSDSRKSRFDTVHRWSPSAPAITVTSPGPGVIPAGATLLDAADDPHERALFETDASAEAPRHRFRLDGIAAQVGN